MSHSTDSFRAFSIIEREGERGGEFSQLTLGSLPDYDVLVEIAYSSVNYKDGLAVTGTGRIARKLPMVGGVDLAGTVIESRSSDWQTGDRVVVNGWGLSETEWGGYSRYQRLKPEWLMRLPDAFSFEEAMGIGTAGYTAALCVDALEAAGALNGEVLVTGAAGGVGSFAVALLSRTGATVTASTGRPDAHGYLSDLGAVQFVSREVLAKAGSPFQKERWTGGVDSVGGATLANLLAQTRWGGAVAACGLAGSADLPGSVLPFILRSVSLLGVDSVMAPAKRRASAWTRLVRDLNREKLQRMYEVRPFSALPVTAADILAGRIRGRVVIDIKAS
jgi:acrylyl-CoA reductase (NADPH)